MGSDWLLSRQRRAHPDLILLDVEMPGMGGYDVCARPKAAPATRLVPVIILTGGGSDDRLSAWGVGADDFLTKPFCIHEVTARCRSLLRVKSLTDELDTAQAVAVAFSRAVEAKSPFTLGHTERVTSYAIRLGEKIGMVGIELELLKRGALLHDIGKIQTPDAILNKPGKLSVEEFDIIRRHPLEGSGSSNPCGRCRTHFRLSAGTTSGWTAGAIRTGCSAGRSRWRSGCCPWPTCTTPCRAPARTGLRCRTRRAFRSCGRKPPAAASTKTWSTRLSRR